MIGKVATTGMNYISGLSIRKEVKETANEKPREIRDEVSIEPDYKQYVTLRNKKLGVFSALGAIGGATLGVIGGGAGATVAAVALGITGAVTGGLTGFIIGARNTPGLEGLAKGMIGAGIGAVIGAAGGIATGIAAGASAPIIGGITGAITGLAAGYAGANYLLEE